MAFLGRIVVNAVVTGGTTLVSVGAFSTANLAAVQVSARCPSSASNNWDTQFTVQPLPGTGQVRIRRMGNTGTCNVRVELVFDSRATPTLLNSTSLVAGANNFAIAAATLAESWVQSMGMAEQGNRDDQNTVLLQFTSTTNVRATMTQTPSGHEFNGLVVRYMGASVQTVTTASNANWSPAITSVDTARSFHWMTCIPASSPLWRNDEVDTSDILSATVFRTRRKLSGAGLSVTRYAFIIELPTAAGVSVQRGNSSPTAPVTIQNFTVAASDIARSLVKGCGGMHGQYNMADSTGTNTNQDRSCFRFELTTTTNVEARRDNSNANPIVSFELLTWAHNPGGGGRSGVMRRWRNGISRRAMVGLAA